MPHDLSWDEYNAHRAGRSARPLLALALDAWHGDGAGSAGMTGAAQAERVAIDGDPEMTFHTEEQARALVDGLQVLHWDEEDAPGTSFTGPKHWHVFHVVARRPAQD